jgi:hypothetical protein
MRRKKGNISEEDRRTGGQEDLVRAPKRNQPSCQTHFKKAHLVNLSE